MLGSRHLCLRRFGHRPRQVMDGVPEVIASCLPEVHNATRDSLETSLVFFVQTIFFRLVQRKLFCCTGRVRGVAVPHFVPLQQGLHVVYLGNDNCPLCAVTGNFHPKRQRHVSHVGHRKAPH